MVPALDKVRSGVNEIRVDSREFDVLVLCPELLVEGRH